MSTRRSETRGLLKRLTQVLALLIVTALPATGLGREPKVSVQTFEASPHAGDLLMVRTAREFAGGLSWGAFVSAAGNPFTIRDDRYGTTQAYEVVRAHVVTDMFVSWSRWKRFSAGMNLPVVSAAGDAPGLSGAPSASAFGLGDVRLSARYLALPRNSQGFGAGVEAGIKLPSSTEGAYAGNRSVAFVPVLFADYRINETLVAANVAYQVQGADTIAGYDTGGGLRFALGARHGLLENGLGVLGELMFGSSQEDFFGVTGTTLEGQLGADLCLGGSFRVFVAGGSGFLGGIGDPEWRFTAGLRKERCGGAPMKPSDGDADGIPDQDDACPGIPGIAKTTGSNGCPPDGDNDGVWDNTDACPDTAGPKHWDPKQSGCPPDQDQDGIPDSEDGCPKKPGVKHKDAKRHGCPADSDNDGIPDREDFCPTEPGVKTDNEKTNGCPVDTDKDKDGIPNDKDACPGKAGDASKDPERHGCPKPKVTRERIEIGERVEFEAAQAVLMEGSKSLLNAIAALILKHDEIAKVVVEGHTDNTNTAKYNMELSQKRAEAVMAYLVERGVPKEKLEAKGWGLQKPIASNETEEGRKVNRRVEFKVIMKKEPVR
jgi:OmpA-OmpF porin, OOP family